MFGLFIWVVDAIIDVVILQEKQNLLNNIFAPDEAAELCMRSLIVLVFVAMGFYARYVLTKQIELDRLLRDHQERLEHAVADRTRVLKDRTEELEQKNQELHEAKNTFEQMQTLLVRSKKMASNMSLVLEEKVKTRTLELETEVAQRKQAEKTAQLAAQVKSNFLAHMSHEIRTPMNAIIGLSELAIRTHPPEKILDYINKISFSADGLLQIIDDILDFSKIEARKMVLESTPFHIEDVMQHLSDITSFKAEEKDLELLFDIIETVPCYLRGDPLRLGQILINLCNNAIKFTEHGEILVQVKPIEKPGDNTIKLQFCIRDTGIGINPEQQKKLFQSFCQADGSTSRKYGGTGLGLVIGKNLVELMGGELWLESEQGVGSEFLFTAVFALQEDCGGGYVTPAFWRGKRVLIVDGNATARHILEASLVQFGFHTDTVASGQLACDALEAATTIPYELIFMDWKMSATNRLDVKRCLKQKTRLADIPVIFMVTLYTRNAMMQHVHYKKVDGYLLKPVIPANLCELLHKVLGGGDQTHFDKPVKQTPEVMLSIDDAEILLVDDNELNVQIATEFLHQAGLRVTVATNGKEAVETASTAVFDAICMDIQMPEMDGYEATQLIRKRYSYEQLPIIAMTAHTMVGDREKCLAAGMNDFVGKPIDQNQLFSVLRKWIAPDRVKNPPKVTLQRGHPTNVAALDLNLALQRVGGKQEMLLKLLLGFAKTYRDTADALRTAFAAGDLSKLYQVSHTLKGLAGSIGAERLRDVCSQLEVVSHAGDVPNIPLLLDRLEQALAEVMQVIDTLEPCLTPTEASPQQSAPGASLVALLMGLNVQLEKGDGRAEEAISEIARVLPTHLHAQCRKMAEHINEYDFEDAQSVLVEIAEALDLVLEDV